jgi:hypothetical protein
MEKINFDVIFKTNLKQIENALKDLRKIIKQMGKQVIEIDLKPSKNTIKEFSQKILKSPFESNLIPRDLTKKILSPVFSALPFQFKGVLKVLYGDIDKNLVDYQKKLEKFNKDIMKLEQEQLKKEKELIKQKERERKEINRILKELQKEVEKEEKERLRREKELQKQRERQLKEFQRNLEKSKKELATKLTKPLSLFDSRLIPKELQLKTLLPTFFILPNQFKNVLNTLFNDLNKNFNNILEKAKKDIENKLAKPLLGSKLIPKNLLLNTLIPTYGILPNQFKGVLKPLENLALGFKKAGIEKDKFRDNVKTLSPIFSELEKRAQKGLNTIKRDFRDLSFELGMLAFQVFILFYEFNNILRGFENFSNKVLEIGGEVQLLERRLQSLFRASNVGMTFVSKSLSDFIALSIKTPVTLRDIIDSFTQMKAVGLDSVDVLKLTIDTAVAFGKDVSQIADDIARAIEGDAVAYKNLRHSIGLTNIKLKELGGVVDSSGRLFLRNSEAVEKNAQALIKYIAQFKGTAENTLGTIPQLLSNIEDAFVSLNKQVLDSNESLKFLLTLLQEGLVRLAADRSPLNTVVVGIMEFITNVGVLQKGISPLNNSIGTLIMTLTSLTTAMSTTLFTTNELVIAPQRLREKIQALDRDIALLSDSNRELRETLIQQRQELEKNFNTINKYLPSISKNFNSFISTLDKFFLPIIFWTQRLLSVIFWVNLAVLALSGLAAIWDSITRGFRERQKTIEQISDSFKKLGDLVRDTDKMGFISFREEVDKSNKILDEFNNKLKEVESGKEIKIFLEVIEGKKTSELIDFFIRTKIKSFNVKINEDVLDTLRSFKQNIEGIADATNRLSSDIKVKVDASGIDELSNKLKSINKNLNELNEQELINLVKSFKLVNYEVINLDKSIERVIGDYTQLYASKAYIPKDIFNTVETIKEISKRLEDIEKISIEDLMGYENILKNIGKEYSKFYIITNSLINIIELRKKELNLQEKLIKSIEITIQKQKQFRDLLLDITSARIRDSLVEQFTNLNQKQNNAIDILINYIFIEDELIKLDKRRIDILGKIEEKQKRINEIQEQVKDVSNESVKLRLNREAIELQTEIVKLTEEKYNIDKEYSKKLEQINNLSNIFAEQLQDIIKLEYEGVNIFNLQAKEVEKFRNELSFVLDYLVKIGKLNQEQANQIKKNISIFSERLQLQEREKNVYEFLNKSLTYANSIEEIRNQVLVMRNFLLNEITKKEKYLGDLSKEKLEVIKKTNQIEKEAIDKLLEARINFWKTRNREFRAIKGCLF